MRVELLQPLRASERHSAFFRNFCKRMVIGKEFVRRCCLLVCHRAMQGGSLVPVWTLQTAQPVLASVLSESSGFELAGTEDDGFLA